jgi:hypothetical protein
VRFDILKEKRQTHKTQGGVTMKIKAKFDLTIYGDDVDTYVSAGDEFEVTDYQDVTEDLFEATVDGEWATLIKSDWEIIK